MSAIIAHSPLPTRMSASNSHLFALLQVPEKLMGCVSADCVCLRHSSGHQGRLLPCQLQQVYKFLKLLALLALVTAGDSFSYAASCMVFQNLRFDLR